MKTLIYRLAKILPDISQTVKLDNYNIFIYYCLTVIFVIWKKELPQNLHTFCPVRVHVLFKCLCLDAIYLIKFNVHISSERITNYLKANSR